MALLLELETKYGPQDQYLNLGGLGGWPSEDHELLVDNERRKCKRSSRIRQLKEEAVI